LSAGTSSAAELAQVARLFYVRGLTKLEIAERLAISRFKVTRLLEQALDAGVVRIEIDEPVPVDERLAAELEAAFGLRTAVVAPAGRVAAAAAAALPGLVPAGGVLGVAWGRTLSEAAELLEPVALRPTVVQICGAVAGVDPGTGPTEVALRFADKLDGAVVGLPAPAVTSEEARRDLLANPAVQPALELFGQVETALVGVGVHERGGHVLTHVFDERGTLADDLPAIAIGLGDLRRARVVAVAGGAAKRRAVLGALRTGLLDDLITDVDCARAALVGVEER
jgi:DNA-binding transcriptional regulator LsrR (DeoR family)